MTAEIFRSYSIKTVGNENAKTSWKFKTHLQYRKNRLSRPSRTSFGIMKRVNLIRKLFKQMYSLLTALMSPQPDLNPANHRSQMPDRSKVPLFAPTKPQQQDRSLLVDHAAIRLSSSSDPARRTSITSDV